MVTSSRLGREITRRFVGEEARELTRDAAEVDRLRALVAERQHAVGDERMVDRRSAACRQVNTTVPPRPTWRSCATIGAAVRAPDESVGRTP